MSTRRRFFTTLAGSATAFYFGASGRIIAREPGDIGNFVKLAMGEIGDRFQEGYDKSRSKGIRPMMLTPPRIEPFADWDFFYLTKDLIWEPNKGQTYQSVTVPRGFVTDLASVPRAFWSAFKPTGRYAYAAVVHDYLYWSQERTRLESDEIFRVAMEDAKTPTATVLILYNAVRTVGELAWDSNRRAKDGGEQRIMKCEPRNRLVSWDEWRKRPDVFKSDAEPDCAPRNPFFDP